MSNFSLKLWKRKSYWEAIEKKDKYERTQAGQAKEDLPSRKCHWIS